MDANLLPVTVLIAEDEPSLRRLTARLLSRAGFAVIEAENGVEALAHLQADGERRVAFLVSDIVMPLMNGYRLAEAARAARPDLRILFVSGYADEPMAGVNADIVGIPLLKKPFTGEDLIARIRAMLSAPAPSTR